jgi:carboxypeptidase Q
MGPYNALFAAAALAAGVGAYDLVTITAEMQSTADAVLDAAIRGLPAFNNTLVFDRLAYLTDTFGPRLSGSQALEDALSWVRDTAIADGLLVREQPVNVTRWVRGTEWARMVSPRNKTLHFLGLGMSNGTAGAVVTAPVMVVRSKEELDARNASVAGKIVVFNPPWVSYGDNVGYRFSAASWVADYGGVGALVKAIGPWGLQTPHTGASQTAAVPAGAISMEDATQMQRMCDRGQDGAWRRE